MKDIELIKDNGIMRFQKKLWHESELLLAKCFCFVHDETTGVIESDLRVTSKRALFEFIKLSFRNFSESPLEEYRRQFVYREIEAFYEKISDDAYLLIKKLPYADRFYPHQKDTLIEGFYKKYNFLALDRRLGKTIISASISRIHQCKRTVIICPATAKWNAWFRDLTSKFGFNELYFTILDSKRQNSVKAFNERFVLINYDIVSRFEKELCSSDIDHFIFDECHRIKNRFSNRTKAIKALVEKYPNARITFLSGTPIRNRVNDVFSYLNIIGHELGKSYTKFCKEYTITSSGRGGDRVTGGRNLQDLKIKLSNFMIRKKKEDCIGVPKQTFTSYKFKLEDYREEYNKVIEEMASQKEISSLTGNIHSANIITSKAKLNGIIELAEEIIENGEKVVIFSNYTEPLKMLEEHFKDRCVKITGSVDPYKRDSIVEKFRTDPSVEAFLGNMESAGEAINLSIANEIIVVDYPLVPGTLHQAIDRCIEIGKESTINVNYTFCEDGIDEYTYDIIIGKEEDINAVIDSGKEVQLRENMTELLIKRLLNKDVTFKNTKNVVAEATVQTGEGQDNSHTSTFVNTTAESSGGALRGGSGSWQGESGSDDFPNFD